MLAWMKERFPFVNLISALLLFALVAATSRYVDTGRVYWQWLDLGLALAIWFQFLVLRVIDEHKDYQQDLVLHPDRVLQKGQVTLGQLRILGVFAFFATLLITWFGSANTFALFAWLVVQCWTVLMAKEFFVGSWLKRHLFIYSVSHMLVLPLMVIWMYELATSQVKWNGWAGLFLLAITFANGLIYEISRKLRGAEEERAIEPSFSAIWGARRASVAVIVLLCLSFAIFVLGGAFLFHARWAYLAPAAMVFLLSLGAAYKFGAGPDRKARKANEGTGALYVLIAYLSWIFLAQQGH